MSSPNSLPPSDRDVPKPDRPLLLRLYSCPHLVELVRLFRDREIPRSAAQEELQPLIEKFGKPRILAATDEILTDREADGTTWFRLSDDVRRMAAPLLGLKPETGKEPRNGDEVIEPSAVTSSSAEASVSAAPAQGDYSASSSMSASIGHAHDAESRLAPAVEKVLDGFRTFESFLLHYWISSDGELCRSLIDAACDDLEHSPKVIDEGWSIHDAALYYMTEELRDFAEQEAFARSNSDPDSTRRMLERIEWWEIAEALLSYE